MNAISAAKETKEKEKEKGAEEESQREDGAKCFFIQKATLRETTKPPRSRTVIRNGTSVYESGLILSSHLSQTLPACTWGTDGHN